MITIFLLIREIVLSVFIDVTVCFIYRFSSVEKLDTRLPYAGFPERPMDYGRETTGRRYGDGYPGFLIEACNW